MAVAASGREKKSKTATPNLAALCQATTKTTLTTTTTTTTTSPTAMEQDKEAAKLKAKEKAQVLAEARLASKKKREAEAKKTSNELLDTDGTLINVGKAWKNLIGGGDDEDNSATKDGNAPVMYSTKEQAEAAVVAAQQDGRG